MKERLTEFLAYLKIGQKKFEVNCGLSNGFVDKMKDNITLKTVDKISEAYPELNISWLRSGTGEMLNTDSQQSDEQCECPISSITDSIAKIAESVAIIAKGNMELIKQHGILIEMLNNKK